MNNVSALRLPPPGPAAAADRAPEPVPPIDPRYIRANAAGQRVVEFLVPDMRCAGCLARVERKTGAIPGVALARANLTTKRLAVTLRPDGSPEAVLAALVGSGENARPFDAAALADDGEARKGRELVRAMAVAGFAAANVMLLSVSVWSGADGTTRALFYWLSALIALPAIAYSGRPFFRSAAGALRHFRTNMDVPISIGILVATALSLYETIYNGEHAWFDASLGLLFFLLVGRVLDHRMRDVARGAAARLLSLAPTSATLILPDGRLQLTAIDSIRPGDLVRVAAGERVPVDGEIVGGASDIDRSMLTGEALPEAVVAGSPAHAGAINLTGALDIRVTAPSNQTLLAGIVRLMEAVERPDGRFVRIADRAARLYAPVVHLTAFATFIGWLALGFGAHASLTAAVAVLIITCPCALGLAVPAVQVVAAGRLLARGIILKDGGALERLAEVDTIVFDKTGTLTRGEPRLVSLPDLSPADWRIAAGLAALSRHPLSRAVAAEAEALGIAPATIEDAVEHPGCGIEGRVGESIVRLGRPRWVGAADAAATGVWLGIGDRAPAAFHFADALRPGAADIVAALRRRGFDIRLVSGDARAAVDAAAREAGIETSLAECLPQDKVAALEAMAAEGRKVLMVGDGINDAPALAAAHVSMSPGSGSDITQAAAGLVFTGDRLDPVIAALDAARAARAKIRQNFALAIGYNVLAVPLAILGWATPLVAAIAMSTSSIIVVANALTLSWRLRPPAAMPASATAQSAPAS